MFFQPLGVCKALKITEMFRCSFQKQVDEREILCFSKKSGYSPRPSEVSAKKTN